MPHLFRTADGALRPPGKPLPLFLADGTAVEGIWAGCAQKEKLAWWLRKPGNVIARTAEVAAVAIKAEDNGELNWSEAPAQSRLLFVLEPPVMGKSGGSYRLAKMVTLAATPEQLAHFRNGRFAFFEAAD